MKSKPNRRRGRDRKRQGRESPAKRRKRSAQARRSKACAEVQAALGARIRKLRQGKDWSQRELATRCFLHPSHAGMIERGEANLRLDTLLGMAEALETSVAHLLKGLD